MTWTQTRLSLYFNHCCKLPGCIQCSGYAVNHSAVMTACEGVHECHCVHTVSQLAAHIIPEVCPVLMGICFKAFALSGQLLVLLAYSGYLCLSCYAARRLRADLVTSDTVCNSSVALYRTPPYSADKMEHTCKRKICGCFGVPRADAVHSNSP